MSKSANAANQDGTKILQAIEKGNGQEAITLMNGKDPSNIRMSNFKWNPLHAAVFYNRQDVIDYLVKLPTAQALVTGEDINKETPLHMAAFKKNTEAYDKIVAAGGNPGQPNALNQTPQMIMVKPKDGKRSVSPSPNRVPTNSSNLNIQPAAAMTTTTTTTTTTQSQAVALQQGQVVQPAQPVVAQGPGPAPAPAPAPVQPAAQPIQASQQIAQPQPAPARAQGNAPAPAAAPGQPVTTTSTSTFTSTTTTGAQAGPAPTQTQSQVAPAQPLRTSTPLQTQSQFAPAPQTQSQFAPAPAPAAQPNRAAPAPAPAPAPVAQTTVVTTTTTTATSANASNQQANQSETRGRAGSTLPPPMTVSTPFVSRDPASPEKPILRNTASTTSYPANPNSEPKRVVFSNDDNIIPIETREQARRQEAPLQAAPVQAPPPAANQPVSGALQSYMDLFGPSPTPSQAPPPATVTSTRVFTEVRTEPGTGAYQPPPIPVARSGKFVEEEERSFGSMRRQPPRNQEIGTSSRFLREDDSYTIRPPPRMEASTRTVTPPPKLTTTPDREFGSRTLARDTSPMQNSTRGSDRSNFLTSSPNVRADDSYRSTFGRPDDMQNSSRIMNPSPAGYDIFRDSPSQGFASPVRDLGRSREYGSDSYGGGLGMGDALRSAGNANKGRSNFRMAPDEPSYTPYSNPSRGFDRYDYGDDRSFRTDNRTSQFGASPFGGSAFNDPPISSFRNDNRSPTMSDDQFLIASMPVRPDISASNNFNRDPPGCLLYTSPSPRDS
eukprot:TRINITY_DN4170_c0_g1_i6.p1 TRINITY_DN4170_c0_g1~~TRINITY_DN4170_c0_g1_i6.p1  ORF type:complete len:776 (-),score=162.70 TRINITY_DN4170_c0_g1_i6:39-2366(-)